jgi:hypothetical protein
LNYGKLRAERVAAGHVRHHFSGLPIFIETYQVGVIEGLLRHYGSAATLSVMITDLANGCIDIRLR